MSCSLYLTIHHRNSLFEARQRETNLEHQTTCADLHFRVVLHELCKH
jgi:hypothetical protein